MKKNPKKNIKTDWVTPPCFCCHIIPDVMLKSLKKQGIDVDTTRQTQEVSSEFRDKRNIVASFMVAARGISPPGEGKRWVYDCQNSRDLQKKVVRNEQDKAISDAAANACFENAGIIRTFFKQVLNWDSVDDNGLDIFLNIHYQANYNNAFWDGEQMAFGDGDGSNFVNFAHALDVTAHEISHGVIQYAAGLEYKNMSGALNEHFADVFATAIKQWQKKQTAKTADWGIGESCLTAKFKGKTIRSMKSPADMNVVIMKQPDHMKDIYKGTQDKGGVHINSGILNKAFYLVAMEMETIPTTVLWFETLKTLSSTAKFLDFYKALLKVRKNCRFP
jgi:Zn-dependent metalloprotease